MFDLCTQAEDDTQSLRSSARSSAATTQPPSTALEPAYTRATSASETFASRLQAVVENVVKETGKTRAEDLAESQSKVEGPEKEELTEGHGQPELGGEMSQESSVVTATRSETQGDTHEGVSTVQSDRSKSAALQEQSSDASDNPQPAGDISAKDTGHGDKHSVSMTTKPICDDSPSQSPEVPMDTSTSSMDNPAAGGDPTTVVVEEKALDSVCGDCPVPSKESTATKSELQCPRAEESHPDQRIKSMEKPGDNMTTNPEECAVPSADNMSAANTVFQAIMRQKIGQSDPKVWIKNISYLMIYII